MSEKNDGRGFVSYSIHTYVYQPSLTRLFCRRRAREWFGPDPVSLFSPRLDDPLVVASQPGSLTGHSVDTVPEQHSASDPAHAGESTTQTRTQTFTELWTALTSSS